MENQLRVLAVDDGEVEGERFHVRPGAWRDCELQDVAVWIVRPVIDKFGTVDKHRRDGGAGTDPGRARTGAPEGDIFTPRAARVFKKLISQAARGDYGALMAETHEDRDELGRAMVNGRWPGTALTTMPPDMLALLPPLPRELEYRFVHRDLVLWDVRADLIVDVLRDAIPVESDQRTTRRRRDS